MGKSILNFFFLLFFFLLLFLLTQQPPESLTEENTFNPMQQMLDRSVRTGYSLPGSTDFNETRTENYEEKNDKNRNGSQDRNMTQQSGHPEFQSVRKHLMFEKTLRNWQVLLTAWRNAPEGKSRIHNLFLMKILLRHPDRAITLEELLYYSLFYSLYYSLFFLPPYIGSHLLDGRMDEHSFFSNLNTAEDNPSNNKLLNNNRNSSDEN